MSLMLTALPSEFPESLPPVQYFLQAINTPWWINIIRTAAAVIVAATVVIIVLYGKKVKAKEKDKNKESE